MQAKKHHQTYNRNPSPGRYQIESEFLKNLNKNKGISLSFKTDTHFRELKNGNFPDPGSYQIPDLFTKNIKNNKGVTIKKSQFNQTDLELKKARDLPGPG